MNTFKDNAGREWSVEINTPAIRSLRDTLGVNFAGDMGATIRQVGGDLVLLIDTVWHLIEPQAKAKGGITAEQFATAMGGDAIPQAQEALIRALAAYLPTRKGAVLLQLWEKIQQGDTALLELAASKVAELDVAALLADALKRKEGE